MAKQEGLPQNEPSLKKVGMSPEELAKAKAEMGEFEYIGGKFVKRGSESHEKATKADDVREIEKLRKKVGESNEEKERRELLEEINISGRLGATTSVGSEFGKKRGVSSGFQNFIDGKSKDESLNSALRDSVNSEYGSFNVGMKYPFSRESAFGAHNIRYLLEENNINAAVTITPVIIKRPVYEKKTVEKGILWWKSTQEVQEQTGLGERSISIGDLNGNNSDTELAYRIFYYVQGTRENPYIEGDGNREGNIFAGQIFLPESIARKTFTEIENDPSFIKEVLRTLDPELMKTQEDPNNSPRTKSLGRGCMPKIDKIVIVPEGKSSEAFIRNERNIPKEINSKYIKTCPEF